MYIYFWKTNIVVRGQGNGREFCIQEGKSIWNFTNPFREGDSTDFQFNRTTGGLPCGSILPFGTKTLTPAGMGKKTFTSGHQAL